MSPGVEVWEKSHSALQASIVGEVHIKHTCWKFFLPRKHKEKREGEGCAILVLQSSHRHAARKRQGRRHLSHHQEWKAQQYNGKNNTRLTLKFFSMRSRRCKKARQNHPTRRHRSELNKSQKVSERRQRTPQQCTESYRSQETQLCGKLRTTWATRARTDWEAVEKLK